MTNKKQELAKISEGIKQLEVKVSEIENKIKPYLKLCLFCSKIVPKGKGKQRKFCNDKCQYEYYKKIGVFSKGMKKYNSKPGIKEKNLLRTREYHKKHPPKRKNINCERCNGLLIRNQSKWCEDCAKIVSYEKILEWQMNHKKPKTIFFCDKCKIEILDSGHKYCSKCRKERISEKQKKYYENPEKRKMINERSSKRYYKTKKKKYCEVCGCLITKFKAQKFCSTECFKIAKRKRDREYERKKREKIKQLNNIGGKNGNKKSNEINR